MTFALLWRRDPLAPAVPRADRLASGLNRLRAAPVRWWRRGPFAVCAFEDDAWFSVAERRAGVVAIVAGRFDARRDTIERLGGPRLLGAAPSDADLLAAAFDRWGSSCFSKLPGEYVAVIWLESENRLLCARDRLGVEPLFLWRDRGEVVLAGHVAGILAHSGVRPEPNEGFLAEVLAYAITSREETLYRGVERVVAGTAVELRRHDERSWVWAPDWSPARSRSFASAADADDAYLEVLSVAVRDRLRAPESGRPLDVGLELSGGLDSSSVAALASAHVGRDALRSFTVTFPGRACDEARFADEVVTTLGLVGTAVPCPIAPTGWFRESVLATCDLSMTPNGVPALGLRQVSRAAGITGLLNGHGGDERFDVSLVHPVELALRGRIPSALESARRLAPGDSLLTAARDGIARPFMGVSLRRLGMRGGWRDRAPWVTDAFARSVDLDQRIRPSYPAALTSRTDRLAHDASGWEALRRDSIGVLDAMTATRSLSPYDDARVVEFALSLPERHRWTDGQFRAIQRRAMVGRLPEAVRLRTTKAELSHLLVDALRDLGGEDRIRRLRVVRSGWVDGAEIVRRYEELDAAIRAGAPLRDIWRLWLIMAVDEWLECIFPD